MQGPAAEFDISATIVREPADSRELDLPFGAVIHLPQFPPVRAGPFTFGLLPWGASPTGNISVTATIAALTFVVVETSGVRAPGLRGWARTILHVPDDISWFVRVPLIHPRARRADGKLTKPFALAIRLYANMTAGHAVVLALTGLLVMMSRANRLVLAPASLIMAIAIMVLETFVAFQRATFSPCWRVCSSV